MKIFSTFRMRLVLILAVMLIVTLSVQFYLNLRLEKDNIENTELHAQALLAGFSVGVNSISSNDRLSDFVKTSDISFYKDKNTQRIKDILVINPQWEINDSLMPKYLPSENDDGSFTILDLRNVKDLPPLMAGPDELGDDIKYFPNYDQPEPHDHCEAHALKVETSDGRFYVMVILESDRRDNTMRAARPVIYSLAILLFSILIASVLVWRFTRPITNLSIAAKRVGEGDLDFQLKDAENTDEMGQLAKQFNMMTSELKKHSALQARLQESEKSAVVGRLASAIAHEIRNPLNYINLSLDVLHKKFKPEEAENRATFEELTAKLKSEVERINTQISEFLSYSRPTRLSIEPVDIHKVIEESLSIIEPQTSDLKIKFSVVTRGEIPKVRGDREVLRSVFSNLLVNGYQSMEKIGGNLNVILSASNSAVEIEITDTGEGISKENLENIFEPYFSTKETGTGLGLAIVKKIIDDHEGEISVESEVGVGTTFRVRLPQQR